MSNCCTELSYKTEVPSVQESSTYLNSALQMFCLMNNQKSKFMCGTTVTLQGIRNLGEKILERPNSFANLLRIYGISYLIKCFSVSVYHYA